LLNGTLQLTTIFMLTSPLPKAVFLDRDGVINKEVNYLSEISEFEFIPGIFETCKAFQDSGFKLIVITNQSGIARGYYTAEQFHVLDQWMRQQFLEQGIQISATYFCPHHPSLGIGQYKQECFCRKPNPGMILSAVAEHQLDLSKSLLFGDKLSDIESGRKAGVSHCVLLKSGHTVSADHILAADMVFDSLGETESIINWLETLNEF
jgi:D-glycero-D-manno-heptose 1,7-bisphosphate phosphatase